MYTLIGCPLGHSMSPWIHARLFRLSGKTADYTLTEIPTPELAAKMPELRQMKGFNITIPHKVDIIPLLDALDETAERYQSVNCVRNADGKAVGYNTDCTGFLRSVEGMQLGGKVLLIGSGGVGRMMATEAVLHGAELTIVEKDIPRAEALAQELTRLGGSVRVREQAPEEPFDLLMNASPVGMYPKTNACPVDEAVIRRSAAVFDVIYNPTVRRCWSGRQSGRMRSGTATAMTRRTLPSSSGTWSRKSTVCSRQGRQRNDGLSVRLHGLRQKHHRHAARPETGLSLYRYGHLHRTAGGHEDPGDLREIRRTAFP